MRTKAHLAFGVVAIAVGLVGALLWSEWGAVVLLNGFAAICG